MPPGSLPHPPDLDYVGYLRVRSEDGPDDPAAADAVISTQAGASEGPASLDPLARNTVRELRRHGIRAEFWVMDRRDNRVKDATGLAAAVEAGDYRIALDYYYRGGEAGGRRFDGFTVRGERANLLADYGLRQLIEDWHFIHTRELPDPSLRRRKLFIGGHSYGGQMIALYASWDFGDRGDDTDAGSNQIAGYVSVDGPMHTRIAPGHIPVFSQAIRMFWDSPLGAMPVEVVNQGLRLGVLPRTVALPNVLDAFTTDIPPEVLPNPFPDIATMLNVIGIAARFEPEAESLLPHELPQLWLWETLGRVIFGGGIPEMISNQPNFRDFRMTNAAVLGATYSSHGVGSFFATAFGTYDGGPVVERKVPFGTEFNAIPLLGWGTSFATWVPRMAMAEPGRLYTWRNYDRVGEPYDFPQRAANGGPFSTPAHQHCDARQIAAAVGAARLGFLEPYVSTRQYTDELFMLSGNRSGDFRFLRFEDFRGRVPGIQLVSAQLWGKFRWIPGFVEPDAVLVADYSHQDMINAAAVQNDGTPDPVMWHTADFVQRTLEIL
ncbi:hypothetical protein [Nocardia crassostreae]|uniref:hypothetical protein n=1 Tax=Nocardia crassostreae TaxID=53428 RepID=UPI000836C218|nr:hypothetical protein [Nocardia crassostreae]